MTSATTVRITREQCRSMLGDLAWFAVAALVSWGRFAVAPLDR